MCVTCMNVTGAVSDFRVCIPLVLLVPQFENQCSRLLLSNCWCARKHTDTAPNCCNGTLAPQLTSLHGVMNPVHPHYIYAVTRMHTHRGKHGQRFHRNMVMQSIARTLTLHVCMTTLCQSTPSVVLLSDGELMLQRKSGKKHLCSDGWIIHFLWHTAHKLWFYHLLYRKVPHSAKPHTLL